LALPAAALAVAAFQQASDRCNDACAAYRYHGVAPGDPWYRSADSWQWAFQQWLALAGLVAILLAAALAFAGRPRIAFVSALGAVAAELVWLFVFYLPVP
jgi:hypothetical protein